MLWGMFVASLVTWAFGVISAHTFGGRLHVLLAVAIGIIVIRIVQGHRDAARADTDPAVALATPLLPRRTD